MAKSGMESGVDGFRRMRSVGSAMRAEGNLTRAAMMSEVEAGTESSRSSGSLSGRSYSERHTQRQGGSRRRSEPSRMLQHLSDQRRQQSYQERLAARAVAAESQVQMASLRWVVDSGRVSHQHHGGDASDFPSEATALQRVLSVRQWNLKSSGLEPILEVNENDFCDTDVDM